MPAFTASAPGLARSLVSPAAVFRYGVDLNDPNIVPVEFDALWDTGASGTVITRRVAVALDLRPIDIQQVSTASGQHTSNVYLIALGLPASGVLFNKLRVTEGVLPGDIELLIGMDIITAGDFAVSNFNGSTQFTYRVPSSGHVDFVTSQGLAVKKYGAANLSKKKNKKKKR